jgi:nucleotide sugar dehydrogenase
MPHVVSSVERGRFHVAGEPGVNELLQTARERGLVSATIDHAAAAAMADVVVFAVPVMLTDHQRPDFTWMDGASEAIGQGLRPGALVVYETTLPVGTTRRRYGPLLASRSGLDIGDETGFYLAFSPERVFSGRVLNDLKRYPKLVGGVDAASTGRATSFYESVLDADVWRLTSSESAEFAKLAETTYRDVNIALANEFAHYADEVGVDILEVIRGANSQPYSHIHQPGIGVGGHCIPVYPHLLLSNDPGMVIVRSARKVNDAQVARAVDKLERQLGAIGGRTVLVLGLTYRANVKEMAYSRALPLIHALQRRGADVAAYDPLLTAEEIAGHGAAPYRWGSESEAAAIITQTDDALWHEIDAAWFPRLQVVVDGRNSLEDAEWLEGLTYVGFGIRGATQRGQEPASS